MKYLNLKKINLPLIIILFFSFKGISQNTQTDANTVMGTIIASGNNATGSSGTVTYSIGQVFYTYIGESVYNVAQGIQHDEKSDTLGRPIESIETKTEIEIFVFPNPTTDFVNINMTGSELEKGQQSYQLYDFQGRLIKQNTINQTDTQINLSELSSSVYILQVYNDTKVLKTFKILKK